MVWDARTFGMIIVFRIYFFLLIIRGLSSSSSSFESFIGLCSLAHICFRDLLEEARGHLICCRRSFNFEILTREVETSYTPMGTSYNGIC